MIELYTFPAEELFQEEEPILSISMNAESNSFEVEAMQIQFQNLLKNAHEKVCDAYDEKVCNQYLDQVRGLREEAPFWRSIPRSVVFYITPEKVYYYRLSVPVSEGVTLSEDPYVLPLIANFQYVSYYHLLCLSHDHFKLFNGRGSELQEIDLPEDAPDDHDKALGEELTGGSLNVSDYNGTGAHGMFHGHNEKSNEQQIDQVNYFRIVDKYVYENYTRPTDLPLVVFALPENLADFERLTKNPKFDETTVEASPAQLTDAQIQEKAGKVVGEIIERRYKKLVDRFNEASPEYRLEAQYGDLAMASVQGKIDTLLLEDHYQVNGTIDENGQHQHGPEKNAYINQLVINVLNTNGKVYVLDKTDMPSNTGVAAILRF